jgi:hypothetical protein
MPKCISVPSPASQQSCGKSLGREARGNRIWCRRRKCTRRTPPPHPGSQEARESQRWGQHRTIRSHKTKHRNSDISVHDSYHPSSLKNKRANMHFVYLHLGDLQFTSLAPVVDALSKKGRASARRHIRSSDGSTPMVSSASSLTLTRHFGDMHCTAPVGRSSTFDSSCPDQHCAVTESTTTTKSRRRHQHKQSMWANSGTHLNHCSNLLEKHKQRSYVFAESVATYKRWSFADFEANGAGLVAGR